MASKGQIKFLTIKIENLEQERQNLHKAVDDFVDNVVTEGKSWIESNGTLGSNCQDMCSKLDNVTLFIIEKYDEVKSETDQVERDNDELDPDQSTASASSSSTTTTTSLPLSPPSTAVASSSTHAARSSSVLADHLLLKLQERIEIIEDQMTNMSGKVDEIQEIKAGMGEMKKKIKKSEETNEKSLTKLQGKVDAAAKEYSANRSMDGKWLQKLEDRIGGLNQDMHSLGVDVKTVSENVEDVDKRLSRGEKRIENVEMKQEEDGTKLKTMEKRLETSEKKHEFEKELRDMKSQVSSLSSRVQVVENKGSQPPVGFTAWRSWTDLGSLSLSPVTVVKDFPCIACNKGDHYSLSTGIFTAPVDGMYMVALNHMQDGTNNVWLRVICERVNPGRRGRREEIVCETYTSNDRTSCCSVGGVMMMKNDKLFVRSMLDGMIYGPSGFSCFLIR